MVRVAFVICLVLYGILAEKPTTMTEDQLLQNHFGPTNSGATDSKPCNEVCAEGCSNEENEENFPSIITVRKLGEQSTVEGSSCPCECCGYRKEKDMIRSIGGATAQHHEFPWIVAILKGENIFGMTRYVYKCVGSLIHPKVVLTVAHYMLGEDPNTLKIRAGRYDLSVADDPLYDRHVSRIVIHEHFNNRSLINDIALLFLADTYTIGGNVNTICLPPPNQNFDLQSCLVSGWGKDFFNETGKYTDILKTVGLPIVPKDKCLTELRKAGVGRNFKLHDSVICAGGEAGVDTCTGDGGAALICQIPGSTNKYHQVGIVSWGIRCGESIPGGYVNVPLFTNWIKEQLER